MSSLLLWFGIGIAGAAGAMCRASLDALVLKARRPNWPAGIFLVNVLGCFFFGLLAPLLAQAAILTPLAGKVLTTGFLGGFTTFSTAMVDVVDLLRSSRFAAALTLLLGTFGTSVLSLLAGSWITTTLIL